MRVPMQRKQTSWVSTEDAALNIEPPIIGRRFSMDINEEVLLQIGTRALESAVDTLGRHIAYEHRGDIQAAIDRYLFDASWVKPIIEDEMRRAAREFVMALWSDEEKQNLRDWFDVFAGKLNRT